MSSDQPTIVKKFSDTASSLDEQLERVGGFRNKLDEYTAQVKNMNDTEQEAFYDSATSIANQVEDIDGVNELLGLENRIEEAIRSPLERIAREYINQFLNVVNPQITKETRESVLKKLSDKLPNELEAIKKTYQDLIPKVRKLPSKPQDLVAARIEKSTSPLLAPHEDIEPFVEKLQERHPLLTGLETAFQDAGRWAPTIEFTNKSEFYTAADPTWDADDIRNKLNKIQSKLSATQTTEFSLDRLVRMELNDELDEFNLAETRGNIHDIKQELASAVDLYEQLEEPITTLDNFGTNRGVFENEIDDLLMQHDQISINQHGSLEELNQSLNEFSDDIRDFIDKVATRLNAQRKMVNTLESEAEADAPTIHIGISDMVITSVHIQDNLQVALEDTEAHSEWINTTVGSGGEDMIDIWQKLSEGERIALSDDNKDEVLELANKLPLGVVLRGK